MSSLNLLVKSSIALGIVACGGVGIAYGISNSLAKNSLSKLSEQKLIEEENSKDSFTSKDTKDFSETSMKRENHPKINALQQEENDLSQLRINSQQEENLDKRLKDENQESSSVLIPEANKNLESEHDRLLVNGKEKLVAENVSPKADELVKDSFLSKSYFVKGERDFLEEEEWSSEDCTWEGSDLKIKLKCQWSHGEIFSKSREVIFNFSEKNIFDHQLNNSEIRNKITEIHFEPFDDWGELSLIFDSYKKINIKLDQEISSVN